jgi:hypothetical protein
MTDPRNGPALADTIAIEGWRKVAAQAGADRSQFSAGRVIPSVRRAGCGSISGGYGGNREAKVPGRFVSAVTVLKWNPNAPAPQ